MTWRCMLLGHVADERRYNSCKLCGSHLPSVPVDDYEIAAAFDEGYKHSTYETCRNLHRWVDERPNDEVAKEVRNLIVLIQRGFRD